MCQLLVKGAILALSPVQGMGRAVLFPTPQSICVELHMTPKPGEAFLGLGMSFKTMQRGVFMQSPVSWAWENAGGTAPCLQSLLCCWRWILLPLMLWDRGTLSPWDPAERRHLLHSLPLSQGSVSSAVVPGPFVLKWCSAKANEIRSLSKEFG